MAKTKARGSKVAGKGRRGAVLDRVRDLALNLRWAWDPQAQRLLASMDPMLWEATEHNPLKMLRLLPPERRELLEQDEVFGDELAAAEGRLGHDLARRTWFEWTWKGGGRRPVIAYFCAEFAVHESLPQYSGGLGVLAGDHVKSASDLGIPLVGVGLLYRCGYYTQEFRPDGSTRVVYPLLDFSDCPLRDTGKAIDVPMGRGRIAAKIWVQQVGRVPLILLDSDLPRNATKDRTLTRHLYGGDREYRIRQEILLGVGGAMALAAMGIAPSVYHLNEGHAAFCAVHRLRELVAAGRSYESAVQQVRRSTVFTTHTPVPAGNERFAPKLAWKYLEPMATAIGLDRRAMMGLGREEPANEKEDFCMTVLALRLAEHCNGVAELHGETSRRMWKKVYRTDDPSEVPIGHVTNGVHTRTWLAPEMDALYAKYLKPDGDHPSADGVAWGRADRIPAEALWAARGRLRHRMIEFIRQRLVMQLLRQRGSQEQLDWARAALDEEALTIGFARRFATYKRAPLIFRDAKRLANILNDPRRPVQLVFAGKAHPADIGGQGFAQEIYRHAEEAKFRGRVVVLEDYDLEMGRMLTSGCDVWLNNPRRPQEASGTSGMKPPLHGGINCSILDGWWPEAYNGRNGWEIGEGVEFHDEAKQDRHDAQCIYRLLAEQIVPKFYQRDRAGVPRRWVKRMIESMKTVCPQFNTHRMVREYWEKYYSKAARSS